jgi:hypothetical protein
VHRFFALTVACALAGCGPSKPTRESAFQPIVHALRTQTKDFNVQTAEGCFTLVVPLSADFDFLTDDELQGKNVGLQKPMRDALARERQLGLIRFNHSQTPFSRSAPVSSSCDTAVRSTPAVFLTADFLPQLTLVQWRSVLTDKAIAVGVAQKGSFPYVEQRLVAVTGLIEQDATTTLIDYEWEWTPTPFGSAFDLVLNGKGTGRAIFRKYDDGWRIERVSS